MRTGIWILAAAAATMIVISTILALEGNHALWGTAAAMALMLIGMFFVPIGDSEPESKDQLDKRHDA